MNIRELTPGQETGNLSVLYGKIKKITKGKNLYDIFSETAEKYPERYALAAEGKEYTYSEFKVLTDRCAAYLYEKGVRSNQKIAVTGYRNVYTMAVIYAVLKLKATYVPIDTEYSVDRIGWILETSGSEMFVLTGQAVPGIDGKVPVLNVTGEEFAKYIPDKEIQTDNVSDPGTYIIYTSGTTGKPKGSLIRNDDVLNLCEWYNDEFNITEQSRVMFLYSFGFDSSVKNIFSPFFVGAEVILGSEKLYDMDSVMNIIRKYRPSHLNTVPKLIDLVIKFDKEYGYRNIGEFSYLLSGGEALTGNIFSELDGMESPMIGNLYGPTECTSVNTFMKYTISEILNTETVSIGRPAYNKIICITDKNGEILEKGQKGEILIAGLGVSDGYINLPESESFITGAVGRIYRTGDIGYIGDGDCIEFCGRNDSQVKIDGHRIELREIKCTAEAVPGVEWFEAKIISSPDGRNELVGFIRMNRETELEKVRSKMLEWLPVYMIPSCFVPVDNIPLTVHGKTDYDSLTKAYHALKTGHKIIGNTKLSSDKNTALMVRLWSEVLGTEEFGLQDDFFQAGGSSMKLIDLKMKLRAETGKEIGVIDLLDASTVSRMADLLSKEKAEPEPSKKDNAAQERIRARLARRKKLNR